MVTRRNRMAWRPKMDELWSGAKDAATVAQEIADEANPLFARSE
jgi:hypothetical protein